jgi:hypothetical protein
MTDDEIDRLTIAEVRAINARAEAALRTLRELGLMGGAAGNPQPAEAPSVPAAPPARRPRPEMPADMRAQREALLAQNRADVLPPEIKALEAT